MSSKQVIGTMFGILLGLLLAHQAGGFDKWFGGEPSVPPSLIDTTAVADSAMKIGASVESGLSDYDYFDIQEPSALVTQYSDTTIVYPIPPGSIIGIQHKYFEPVQRGNFY